MVGKFGPQVRLLRKENGGQGSAFNAGIPECAGEIVAFLDWDDWWAKNKLASVTQAMAEDASVGIVGHGIIVVGFWLGRLLTMGCTTRICSTWRMGVGRKS